MRLRLRHMGLKLGLGINRHGNVTDWRDKGAKHRTDRHGYMTGETEGITKHGYETRTDMNRNQELYIEALESSRLSHFTVLI